MNSLQNIENDIIKLTTYIRNKYPELYTFLDETPITISFSNNQSINKTMLKDYLESLEILLKRYSETHKNK
ncbi:hypothetical protein [Hyunsoonleella aestuarii]|jgi:hypothetical protein|uniref:Uncharacterized protein n=1 Tax=Hyunsoonleella aestuarii TaxID=912802 RepID=A0ABP8ECU9_9FLAO|nr:hypothetical protein [Hyunsoonleella aestuarii]